MGQANSRGENGDVFEKTIFQTADDIRDTDMREVEVEGERVLVVKDGGKLYAIGARCPYGHEQLIDGVVNNGHIRCAQHGTRFNLATGELVDYPAIDCLHSFEVRQEGDDVILKASKSALAEVARIKPSLRLLPHDKIKTVVIIGAGAAGMACAETLRQEGFYGKLFVVYSEGQLPYDRTQLSKVAEVNAEKLALRDKKYWTARDVMFKPDKEVSSVNLNHNKLTFKDGEELTYSKLLIATGATPRKLTMVAGFDLQDVVALRTFNDAKSIASRVSEKPVVIVGASFIGMELAGTLCGQAKSVAVVDSAPSPFFKALGKDVGNALRKLLEEKGVTFHMNTKVKEFVGDDGKLSEVLLTDGTKLPAAICVVAVGVLPSTGFVKNSGLLISDHDHIIVDQYMRTNKPDVFAAGDCAACRRSDVTDVDEAISVQHWQMAQQQGRVAALNILDKSVAIDTVPFYWTTVADQTVRITGHLADFDNVVTHGDLNEYNFVAYYFKNGHVTGVASANQDPIASQAAEVLLTGHEITDADIQCDPPAWTSLFRLLPLTHL